MNDADEPWYRPPVIWLGAAIVLGSLAGCIALIVVASSG
jgi:hypothetical protein